MMRIIRIILSLVLVLGVYSETGIFTALFAFLSLAAIEIVVETLKTIRQILEMKK